MTASEQLKEAIRLSGLSRKDWYRNIYLKSEHWKQLRQKAFAKHGRKCCKCGSKKRLDVHHLNYRSIFDVVTDDLQIICRRHHDAEHGSQPMAEAGWKVTVSNSWLRDATVSAHARLLYVILKGFEGKNCKLPFPSLALLAQHMGCSLGSLHKYSAELVARGWMKKNQSKRSGKFQSTRYELLR